MLAVGEIKSSREGVYQLLAALVRIKMAQSIFPVGELAFSTRKRKLFHILELGCNTISNSDLSSFHENLIP